jgi:hypothetical protein
MRIRIGQLAENKKALEKRITRVLKYEYQRTEILYGLCIPHIEHYNLIKPQSNHSNSSKLV